MHLCFFFVFFQIEHASTIDEVQQSVCDNTVLETASKTVPSMGVPIDKVVDAICGQNGSEWYTRLIEAGLTQTELVGVKNMVCNKTFQY